MNRVKANTLAVCGALALACLLVACGGPRDPNAQRELAEQSARTVYPELPPAEQTSRLQEAGRHNFRSQSCEMCHSITRERKGLLGPPLGGTSERVLERHGGDALQARRWLVKHIRDPYRFPGPHAGSSEYRGASMPPNTTLPDEQMKALVEYLWHLP